MTADTLTPDQFWSRLDGVQAGMLGAGSARHVPMSHYAEAETNRLWFITARGTDLVEACQSGAEASYIVASGDGKLYARIHGRARVETDQAKIDELWNPIAGAWFEDGKDDPDVRLIRMDLSEAEVWATDGGLRFLYETAKAHLTGTPPDMGEHGTIRFGPSLSDY